MSETSKSTKAKSTLVNTEAIVAIAEKLGLKVTAKAAWLRIEGEDKSKRLLVHTGKKGTRKVELVGFESEFAVPHPSPAASTMTQMIDFTLTESMIRRNIYKTAQALVAVSTGTEAPVAEATEVQPSATSGESSEAQVEVPAASNG